MPAEILHEAGFRTAGLWRNGWVEGYFGFDQGFETYTRPNVFPVPADVRRENPTAKQGGTDQDLVRSAEEFWSVNGDQRWFLYLHLMDVHEYTYDATSAQFGTAYVGHLRQRRAVREPDPRRTVLRALPARPARQDADRDRLGPRRGVRRTRQRGSRAQRLPGDDRGAARDLLPVPPGSGDRPAPAHRQRGHLAHAARPARACPGSARWTAARAYPRSWPARAARAFPTATASRLHISTRPGASACARVLR